MINPINIAPIGHKSMDRHSETAKSMAYFAYHVRRKALKKTHPLWCRDYKKIPLNKLPKPNKSPKPKTALGKTIAKIKDFLGGQ